MIQRNTFTKPQIEWTEDKIDLIRKEYPRGDKKELCRVFGISYTALKCAAKRFAVCSMLSPNHNKLLPLLEDTPINYYWYGFIMSDGHLDNEGELKIGLSIKDITHLTKLASLLGSNVTTKKVTRNFGNAEYCMIECKDALNGILLRNKLCITNSKTYNPPNLSFLNTKEKFLCFLAGFIDGDGMIQYGKRSGRPDMMRIMCHASWYSNLNFFKEGLQYYCDYKSTSAMTSRGFSYLAMHRSAQILELKEYYLLLNLPLLERKWRI